MSEFSTNHNRIVKNSLFLYARMLIGMCVSLYTSRIILDALGVTNYGVYNIVGSIVAMSAFLNGAVVTSTQRYITYNLGKGNFKHLQNVFTTSIQIHFILALLVAFLADTIGVWFLYNKMVIPPEKITIAFWVLQLSIITMTVNIMSGPYNSAIIAHEKMEVFAYISLLNIFLNLFLAFTLYTSPIDKLLFFSIMTASIQILIRILYSRYCFNHFEETKPIKIFKKKLFKEMVSFAGWNIWGNLANVIAGQGINMLLNIFFGPIVNAARGIALQVDSAINQFARNFLIAVDPQITKSFASNNIYQMQQLMNKASKFSFFLLFLLSLPVFIETKNLLNIWLVSPPNLSDTFIIIILCTIIINSVTRPFITAVNATGKVRTIQLINGTINILIIPFSFVVLSLGGHPSTVFIIQLIMSIIISLVRIIIVKRLINFSVSVYFHAVILKIIEVIFISSIIPLFLKIVLTDNIINTIIICIVCVVSVSLTSYFVGMTKSERNYIRRKIQLYYKTKFFH